MENDIVEKQYLQITLDHLSRFESKYFKLIGELDEQILKNFRYADIRPRPVKSCGLWCNLLLPTILVTYSWMFYVSPIYRLIALLSVGLLFYSILFTIFISTSYIVLRDTLYGGCITSGLISTLLLYCCMGESLLLSLGLSMSCTFSYSTLLRIALTRCQSTFTLGEAMLVVKGIVLFAAVAVAGLLPEFREMSESFRLNYSFNFTVLSTVGLIVTALYFMNEDQKTVTNLGYLILAGSVYALIVLHLFLGSSGISKVWNFIFRDQKRKNIFYYWLSLLALAVMVLVVRTRLNMKANTVTRKSFHILGSLVFGAGVLFDVELMNMASGAVLGILILGEALRKTKIEPVSSAFQSAFNVYSDEKDCGAFAVTPLYLYVGLACPLWLVPAHGGGALDMLAGVLSAGVGDSAASWFGARYGHQRWPGGNRTFEGTAFNIVSQIATVYGLSTIEFLNSPCMMFRTMVAATVSGLVEARTEQVDNLVLPLVTLIAFQSTCFLTV